MLLPPTRNPMLISEVISELEKIKQNVGDIPVYLEQEDHYAHYESTEIEVESSPTDHSPVVTII